jgi:hypothetical protein
MCFALSLNKSLGFELGGDYFSNFITSSHNLVAINYKAATIIYKEHTVYIRCKRNIGFSDLLSFLETNERLGADRSFLRKT